MIAVLLSVSSAWAGAADNPRAVMEGLIARITPLARSDGKGEAAALMADLEPVMAGVFDFEALAETFMGPLEWNAATPTVRARLEKAFARLWTAAAVADLRSGYTAANLPKIGRDGPARIQGAWVVTIVPQGGAMGPGYTKGYLLRQGGDGWRVVDIWDNRFDRDTRDLVQRLRRRLEAEGKLPPLPGPGEGANRADDLTRIANEFLAR